MFWDTLPGKSTDGIDRGRAHYSAIYGFLTLLRSGNLMQTVALHFCPLPCPVHGLLPSSPAMNYGITWSGAWGQGEQCGCSPLRCRAWVHPLEDCRLLLRMWRFLYGDMVYVQLLPLSLFPARRELAAKQGEKGHSSFHHIQQEAMRGCDIQTAYQHME